MSEIGEKVKELLAGKKILVLGYGVNHVGLVRLLIESGLSCTIRDRDQAAAERFQVAHPGVDAVTFEVVPEVTRDLQGYEVVFRSPSIPYRTPALQKVKARGVLLSSQTQLFLDLCPAQVVGVTGTKGKGTTSTLLTRLLEASYKEGQVYLAGNIGLDPLTFLGDLTEKDVVVLELSSFQLQGLTRSPQVAVLLHVTADHLDHHGSLEEYREVKGGLLAHQTSNDLAIVNAEYPEMRYFLERAQGKLLTYTRYRPGRQCAWVDVQDGEEILFYQVDEILGSFPITKRKLLGAHNLENILPAVLVAASYGATPEILEPVVREFKGLEHRLAHLGRFAGVEAYDDSIATTPESCAVALQAFTDKRVHLFAGGADKGQHYTELAPSIVQYCATLTLLPGKATSRLEKAVRQALKRQKNYSLDILTLPDRSSAKELLEGGMVQLRSYLQEGDVILLSPAASSVGAGPFRNYKERGDAFAEAIRSVLGGEYGTKTS